MMHATRLTSAVVSLCFVFSLGCGSSTTTEEDTTITGVAAGNSSLTRLTELLEQSGLDATLRGTGPFTVFAPTDAAFADIETQLSSLSTAEVKAILEYHVVSGSVDSAAVSALTSASTVQGSRVLVDASSGVMINDATVSTPDVMASNGIVHVIDKVLLPPSGDIVAVASADADNFSVLTGLLTNAGLVSALQADGPLTVFAPTNAAFDALAVSLGLSDASALAGALTAEQIEATLLNHVVNGFAAAGDLVDGTPLTPLLNGQSLSVDLSNGAMVGGATVATANVLATNGIVHVIDAVMVPNDVVATASENSDFSTLVAALTKAELVVTLQGAGPFTVFAPTNAAFAAAGIDQVFIDSTSASDLAAVLTYHVVEGQVLSTDLTAGDVTTVNGDTLTVDLSEGVTLIDGDADSNDAQVTTADIRTFNGVIHVIDQVLIPTP